MDRKGEASTQDEECYITLMDLILEDKNKRTINTKEEIAFSSFSSWHLVTITARAEGEKQLKSGSTDDTSFYWSPNWLWTFTTRGL